MSDLPVVPLIIRGEIIEDNLIVHEGRGGGTSFRTPDVNKYIDQLPLRNHADLKDMQALTTDEVIDFLVEFGQQLDISKNTYLQQALELSYDTAPTTRPIVADEYSMLSAFFNRELLEDMIARERAYFDGWVEMPRADGRICSVRAFGARCLHIVAGNSPLIATLSIARSALTRGDAIFKSPSNDPVTASAILRTLCEFAPDHPITRHCSVAYWKGGDVSFEKKFYLPANIEKILAWGGFASVKHVTQYIQPGLELISLDPKRSISVIGPETFDDEEMMKTAALRVATDIGQLNQVACVSARKIYVMTGTDSEGVAKANRFGKMAYDAMMGLPEHISTKPKSFDPELRSNVNALRFQDEWYKVIGGEDDEGAIIVSQHPQPVEFDASLKDRVANFIPVDSVEDIARDCDAYTQTVGVYPESFKSEVRELLPLYGGQRITSLGYACAADSTAGPHDGIEPLRRMAKWLVDENCVTCAPRFNTPPWLVA